MVSNTIVSRFTGELPKSENGPRHIAGGPLYSAEEVRQVLDRFGAEAVKAWTRKCIDDVQKLGLDADELRELVESALGSGRFRGSEWCVQYANGPWAACDAYSLVRREWIENAHKFMDIEYYLKIAISKTGRCLLMASCHPPEQRN